MHERRVTVVLVNGGTGQRKWWKPKETSCDLSLILHLICPTDLTAMEMKEAEPFKQPSLESAQTLMQHGPHVLHDFMATKIEAALGRALPQMEIRVNDVSLTAEIMVADQANEDRKPELPRCLTSQKSLRFQQETLGSKRDPKESHGCLQAGNHNTRSWPAWIWQVVAHEVTERSLPYDQEHHANGTDLVQWRGH